MLEWFTTAAQASWCGSAMTSVPCGRCQVIQDVANGWEGFCLGLQLLNESTTPEVGPIAWRRFFFFFFFGGGLEANPTNSDVL